MAMSTPSAEGARLFSRFGKMRGGGGGWYSAKCPAHDDRSGDSLHLTEVTLKDGVHHALNLKCHAGCSREAVLAAVGLAPKDTVWGGTQRLPPSMPTTGPAGAPAPKQNQKLIREIVYAVNNPDGTFFADHIRREFDNGTKGFWWRRDGQLTLGDRAAVDVPLYGVDEHVSNLLMQFVVEGEKAAESLWARGVVSAVGTVTGAANCPSEAALRPLLHTDVWLWADNDGVNVHNPKNSYQGQRHMNAIAARLTLMDQVPGIILWPEAPPKGDAADYPGDADAIYQLWRQGVVWGGGAEIDGRWVWCEAYEGDIFELARKVLWEWDHKGEPMPPMLEDLFSQQSQGDELPV